MQPKYYGAAADYNKPSGPSINKRLIFFVLAGLGILLLLAVGFAIITSLSAAPRADLGRLILREQQLQAFITTNQKAVRTDELSKVSSEALILVTTDTSALNKQLVAIYGSTEVPPEVATSEVDTTSVEKLKTAASVGKYDQVYLQLLRDKIAASMQLATSLKSSSSGGLTTTLNQNLANLSTIDKQLSALKL